MRDGGEVVLRHVLIGVGLMLCGEPVRLGPQILDTELSGFRRRLVLGLVLCGSVYGTHRDGAGH